MTIAESGLANALTDAIVARDVSRAVALLHPEIDFRAMTPNKFWEASGPAEVDAIFRDWFEDPDEELQSIEATQPVALLNTVRTGWVVHISDARHLSDARGPHLFEQQAYVRERDGQIDWMRVICSGWIPLSG